MKYLDDREINHLNALALSAPDGSWYQRDVMKLTLAYKQLMRDREIAFQERDRALEEQSRLTAQVQALEAQIESMERDSCNDWNSDDWYRALADT
jgi:maltodextrin utilization protein YvdJ